jgi:hypothetical protein
MGTSGRVAVFLLALSGLAGCRWESGGPVIDREDLEVELGTGGFIDQRRWNPLGLRIKNRGDDFRGTLEVQGIQETIEGTVVDPVSYRMEIEVPGRGTTTREIAFGVRPEGWQGLQATFRQDGFARRLRFMIPTDETSRFQLLVIGEDRTDFGALLGEVAESIPAEANPVASKTRVFHRKPSQLPAQSLAYDPFQMVVLWGQSLGDAPRGAIEALSDWVKRGGTLVAFPGEGWAGGMPAAVLDLLGATLGDPRAAMEPLLSVETGPAASSGFYRQLVPAAGTRMLGGGLAFASSHGAGWVLTFSFRPAGAFPEPLRAPGIYSALRPALARSVTFAGDSAAALRELEGEVASSLFELSGFHVPGRSTVVLSLAVYLVVGFLLPYFLIRRTCRQRREWTYLAVLLAAALATVAIYRWGLLSGMDSTEIEEVTVLRLHADGKTAEATCYLGLISPRLQWVDLAQKGPSGAVDPPSIALPQPLRGGPMDMARGNGGLSLPSMTIEVDAAGRHHLSPIKLYPNGIRFLRIDARVEVPDSMRGIGRSLEDAGSSSNRDWTERSTAELVRRAIDGEGQGGDRFMSGRMRPGQFRVPVPPQGENVVKNIEGPLARLMPVLAVSVVRDPVFPAGAPMKRKAITVMVQEQDPWEVK